MIYFEGEKDDIKAQIDIHTDSYAESTFLCNNISTSEGGTHETGLRPLLPEYLMIL